MFFHHHAKLMKQFQDQNKFFVYHLLMIIIFSVIYYFGAKKWGTKKDKINLNTAENCLYYTCTTHFTVGLGDIAPQSPVLRGITIVHVIGAFLLMNV